LEIFGEDVSGVYPSTGLIYARNYGCTLDQGSDDKFQFEATYLGPLKRLKISSDNKLGSSDSWFLERIEVYDFLSNRCYMFIHNNWIELDKVRDAVEIKADLPPSQCKR